MTEIEGALRLSTDSAEATRSVAFEVARLSRPGDLILLIGDLGAGKTVFAQGFAKGIGVSDRVTSPTFALVQGYEGTMRMNHLDVYRLSHIAETADLGLAELLDDDAVTLIEWGDMITTALPHEYLEIRLAHADEPSDDMSDDMSDDGAAAKGRRDIQLSARGMSWRPRLGALGRALSALGDGTAATDPDGEDRC